MVKHVGTMVAGAIMFASLSTVQAAPKQDDIRQDDIRIEAPGKTIYNAKIGETRAEGLPGKPVQCSSSDFKLSAPLLLLYTGKAPNSHWHFRLHAKQGAKLDASLKSLDTQTTLKIETSSDVAHFDQATQVLTLRGDVRGSYQTSSGRIPISGQVVTFSVFKNSISVVQDGVITLETASAN